MIPALIPLVLTSMNPQTVTRDDQKHTVTIANPDHSVELRLNYGGRCMLDQVLVNGRETISATTGACSAIQIGGEWFTTRACPTPAVSTQAGEVRVNGVRYGGGGVEVEENWTFRIKADRIAWHIDRQYLKGGRIDDTYFPGWDFLESSWEGALLGTGGVAWFKLLAAPVTAYGVHTGDATFWNRATDDCLDIRQTATPSHVAVRFSHHPSQVYSFNTSIAPTGLKPKRQQYRCYKDRQDVWAPFAVKTGDRASIDIDISASSYRKRFDRGHLAGLDGHAVADIANTIARLGIIDRDVVGTNGWFSGYVCLHEQWTADLGLAIDDPNALRSCARSLDKWRDEAIESDGRVKSRWAYGDYDCMPGTYDKNGFYEAQWGWLLDSQSGYVTDVAEQFHLSGDKAWVAKHKKACEKALGYLLRRDFNGNGLVEMKTDTVTQKRSSDWIDIVWASYENGYVNAQLYHALLAWAEVEDVLNDPATATRYRQAAAKLKATFNKPVSEGGLWDAEHGCYAYWREKNGDIHGTNTVVPVNFMAIAYGLCDDPKRRATILDQIEAQMQREKLFVWPLCMTSFTPEEGGGGPFPTYENGDIFIGWSELGMRCYAGYKPEIAVRVLKNVMAKYAKDGLAFQRYLRKSQEGAGDDILASNASPIVGLYRDVYGVIPRWNRLVLDPHLTPDLYGTSLKYRLRGKDYLINLDAKGINVKTDTTTITSATSFAFSDQGGKLSYFQAAESTPALDISGKVAQLDVQKWTPTDRRWVLKGAGKSPLQVKVYGLTPNRSYRLSRSGQVTRIRTDSNGSVSFTADSGTVDLAQ